MEDISIESIRETQSLGQKFKYMFKFEMVCLPTLFEKEENAPPVSKPCLLVISRNRKKGLPRSENRNSSSKMIPISREITNNCPPANERKRNQQ